MPIAKIISYLALVVTILPSLLFLLGKLSQEQVSGAALVGTIIWFITTPLWMGRSSPAEEAFDAEPQI